MAVELEQHAKKLHLHAWRLETFLVEPLLPLHLPLTFRCALVGLFHLPLVSFKGLEGQTLALFRVVLVRASPTVANERFVINRNLVMTVRKQVACLVRTFNDKSLVRFARETHERRG